MENSAKTVVAGWMERLSASDKKMKVIIAIGIAGVLLLMLSEIVPGNDSKCTAPQNQAVSYEEYTSALEENTAALIGTIEGVGRCRVMITLKGGSENIYAKNTEEDTKDGSFSAKYEYVLYEGDSGEVPLAVKEVYPAVQGVAIVCDGADNPAVRTCIAETVSALFNISVSKISVTKYKSDR